MFETNRKLSHLNAFLNETFLNDFQTKLKLYYKAKLQRMGDAILSKFFTKLSDLDYQDLSRNKITFFKI